ncbi:MAG: NUDIX hydrolase [Armatimonadetes bacterium]|nr:NUDIX hydrolase [Armatimonadota bacterium]
MKHRVRAAVLITAGDSILLVRHREPLTGNEWWIPPGGGLQADDDLISAARREVFEETGLQVEVSRVVLVREFKDLATNYHHVELFFVADSWEGEVTLANLVPGDEDEPLVKEARFVYRDEFAGITVWPEWLHEDWFWEEAGRGFPNHARYTGCQVDRSGLARPDDADDS